MSKSNNKTQQTGKSPDDFLAQVTPKTKHDDCLEISKMMQSISGTEPKMWGPSIIGFGAYHYKYASGREGDFLRLGFSPRAQNITIYIMPGYQDFDDELARLGTFKTGKSCLYIKRLADVDQDVLKEILQKGWRLMAEKYPL